MLAIGLFAPNRWPLGTVVLVVLIFTALGFFFPQLWLQSRINARQLDVRRALPDALDLLTVCVEAGLGLEAAMSKVADKWQSQLSLAFLRAIREIQLGKARRDAMRDMAERIGLPEMTSFVAAIIQSEILGVSLAKVLRIQSDQMRVRRRQIAEERARQAPVKMILPLALLIFPSILIILLDAGGYSTQPRVCRHQSLIPATWEELSAGSRKLLFQLYHLMWLGIDLLLPPKCGGCGTPGERWCADCQLQGSASAASAVRVLRYARPAGARALRRLRPITAGFPATAFVVCVRFANSIRVAQPEVPAQPGPERSPGAAPCEARFIPWLGGGCARAGTAGPGASQGKGL